MISTLDLHPRLEPAEEPVETLEPQEEFEYVLGRRQIASVLFVFTIVLMICIAAAYLAGKTMATEAVPSSPIVAMVQMPGAPLMMAGRAETGTEPPLLAEPKNGAVYIQMGAVEKGLALVFADGLRRRGLPSMVARGPSDKIFRVLIGPLPNPAAYLQAKDAVDKMGLATFARRFPD